MIVPTAEMDAARDRLADQIEIELRKGLTLDEIAKLWLDSTYREMTILAKSDPKLAAKLRPIYVDMIESAIRQRRERERMS